MQRKEASEPAVLQILIHVREICSEADFFSPVTECNEYTHFSLQSYNLFSPISCIFRMALLKDGSLRIANVSKSDIGSYTCLAENQFGKASSSTTLLVTGN